ncbi:MetQ/NlpA family ABC transporter substrate-binding protein [Streptococcus sp. X16XC17]|uniref:MetQ/NlpA family ABC transporter substrate-binding protein n=1 Tax=unclassified Streptococcus TaxID=2608887 RepID=UPI00066FC08D|nr:MULTISPECIES: MetQ/NlpA family ABC transporter substrate-binding protein [unclassified Streptococcus]TCD45973.1 MetQ/NlpA family ABC transporter substrate-binding protein [Streptococcus sp. X16XC17]
MNLKKFFSFAAVAALSLTSLAACAGASKEDANVVKIGVMGLSDTEEARWDKIKEILGDDVTLEFTEFTDYSQPNLAVAEGEVDVNAFQHYNFLNNWNKENGEDLVAIADTIISPIRLYSGTENGKNKYKSVTEIPEGAEIAVPNDATNESRALYLLQSAGLITLDVSGTELATIVNIKENPKKLTITELDASQTAVSLESVAAAVVNNTFVQEAGLDFENALYKEQKDENSKQWYNVIAAKKDWKDSSKADAIQKVIDAYHTEEVKEVIEKTSQGTDEPVW